MFPCLPSVVIASPCMCVMSKCNSMYWSSWSINKFCIFCMYWNTHTEPDRHRFGFFFKILVCPQSFPIVFFCGIRTCWILDGSGSCCFGISTFSAWQFVAKTCQMQLSPGTCKLWMKLIATPQDAEQNQMKEQAEELVV